MPRKILQENPREKILQHIYIQQKSSNTFLLQQIGRFERKPLISNLPSRKWIAARIGCESIREFECESERARDSHSNSAKCSDILFPYRSPSPRPHPDPTQHPRNGPETDPEQTRNGAERSRTEPKWTKIKPSRVGRPGGFVGMGRGGGCKGKRISLAKCFKNRVFLAARIGCESIRECECESERARDSHSNSAKCFKNRAFSCESIRAN